MYNIIILMLERVFFMMGEKMKRRNILYELKLQCKNHKIKQERKN